MSHIVCSLLSRLNLSDLPTYLATHPISRTVLQFLFTGLLTYPVHFSWTHAGGAFRVSRLIKILFLLLTLLFTHRHSVALGRVLAHLWLSFAFSQKKFFSSSFESALGVAFLSRSFLFPFLFLGR